MLRVDISGYKLSSEHCPKRTRFPDGELEYNALAVFVGMVRPSNHLVDLRRSDISMQDRAEYLLQGRLNDVSISLRTHAEKKPGWCIRLPAEPTLFEKFLQSCLVTHINKMLPKNFVQLQLDGRGVLLPAREHERPARIEMNLCSHIEDTGYRAHTYLHTFARAVTIALSEYDANFSRLSELYYLLQEEKEAVAQSDRQNVVDEEIARVKNRKKGRATL